MPKEQLPMLAHIAEQKDRRLRYDGRMRKAGNRKLTLWCPDAAAADIRAIAGALIELGPDGVSIAAELARLAATAAERKSATVSKAGRSDVAPRS